MQTCPLRRGRAAFGGRPSRRPACTPRALLEDGGVAAVAAGAAVLAAGGGLVAWKVTGYGQLEYITASMLTNYVPKSDPRVVQLQGGTKELYYYPKQTVQVTVVGENINKSLLEQAGVQSAVPTLAKPQSPANLGFAADASVDAVVSLGALAGMSDAQRTAFTAEALRVLKPGCPIIFIEPVPGGLSALRFRSSTLAESYLNGWKQRVEQGAFELVQWDTALEGNDPHAVGIAVKSASYRAPPVSKRAEKAAEKAEKSRAEREQRKEKERLPKKGF